LIVAGRLGLLTSVSIVDFSKIAYNLRDDAAFEGFRWIIQKTGSGWDKTEYAFLVILAKAKTVQYLYSIPETGSNVRSAVTASTDLRIRAFCHTHPESDTTGRFGNDDKENFKETIKIPALAGIAFYLMNHFQEVRIARALEDFPEGKSLPFKP
jgi:hypothetical protein